MRKVKQPLTRSAKRDMVCTQSTLRRGNLGEGSVRNHMDEPLRDRCNIYSQSRMFENLPSVRLVTLNEYWKYQESCPLELGGW